MAPKAVRGAPKQPKSFARTVVDEITKPDNRSVITAVTVFAVRVYPLSLLLSREI